jgi:hypothetical protein
MGGIICIQICSCKSKGKILGRTKHRWKDNIKADLKEIQCESVD